jgi:transcriptional regulator with XRE-family HTH domain
MSQRQLGRLCGLSHSAIGRMERGEVRRLTIDRLAIVAAVLGLELRLNLYPTGSPVRDRAHLALIGRFPPTCRDPDPLAEGGSRPVAG